MVKYVVAVLMVLSSWSTSAAWWETRIDTVEVRYPEGQLKEQYQEVFWGGNDTTRKMGFYRSWYPNGALELDGNYDGDLKIGTWIRWDSTGRRVEEVTFVEGEKHGNEVEWNIDGTVRKWLHYRHGKLHGRYIWFKPGYCINTLYNNPYLFDVIAADQFYVDGDMIAPLGTVSSDSGDIVGCEFQKPYYNLELDIWIVQQSREREYEIGKRVDGKREGTWTVWAEDGSMIRQEFYEQGVRR